MYNQKRYTNLKNKQHVYPEFLTYSLQRLQLHPRIFLEFYSQV